MRRETIRLAAAHALGTLLGFAIVAIIDRQREWQEFADSLDEERRRLYDPLSDPPDEPIDWWSVVFIVSLLGAGVGLGLVVSALL